jgi:hypothetical protein
MLGWPSYSSAELLMAIIEDDVIALVLSSDWSVS